MPLEILNRALVFLRRSLAVERAEIFSLSNENKLSDRRRKCAVLRILMLELSC